MTASEMSKLRQKAAADIYDEQRMDMLNHIQKTCLNAAKLGYSGISARKYMLKNDFVNSMWFNTCKERQIVLKKLRSELPSDYTVSKFEFNDTDKTLEFMMDWNTKEVNVTSKLWSNVVQHCPICMEEKECIVLMPCGHMVCPEHSLKIEKCPSCRTTITLRHCVWASNSCENTKKRKDRGDDNAD